MKKRLSILLLLPLIVFIGFIGCEGPEGPAGPAGATGANGEDGALFCLSCHDATAMDQKEAEFAQAGHLEAYTRVTSASCAPCHSHEGFVQYGNNGQMLEDAFVHGSTMTCGTCHSHQNNGSAAVFDADEVPIRFNDPVVMRTGIDDMDFENNSNVCVRCHQPRRDWSEYDDGMGDMVMITSSHAGPHHGAQVTPLMGLGGDHRLNGLLEGMGPTEHGTDAGCVSCHMVDGNHTFKPVAAACTGCHDVPDDFDYNGKLTDIAAKMETLAGYLTSQDGNGIGRDSTGTWVVIPDSTVHGPLHWEDGEDGEEGAYHPVPGQYERDVYSAFWNFMTVMEDQSGGVHNPPYLEALLNASILVFQ
jgi:hypothetical protein